MRKECRIETRKTYYDFMRIVAAFLVIFNHLPGYVLYQSSSGMKTWMYTFITIFTRINVPIFFMITGALLLGRDEEIKEIFRKRVSRIVAVLILFGSMMSWAKCWPNPQFTIEKFLNELVSGSITTAYWFLYAYISFLVLLPYLRRVVRDFTEKDFFYFVLFHFFIATLQPIINYILITSGREGIVISSNIKFPFMVEGMIFYPIIGYYLDRKVDIQQIKKKQWLLLGGATFAGVLLSSFLTVHEGISTGTFTQNYVMLFDYVIAIFVFVAVKYLFECNDFLLRRDTLQRGICVVGQLTLGMYMLDPILKSFLWWRVRDILEPFLPTLIVSVSWCVISMCLSGAVTYILKKIPGVRKIL